MIISLALSRFCHRQRENLGVFEEGPERLPVATSKSSPEAALVSGASQEGSVFRASGTRSAEVLSWSRAACDPCELLPQVVVQTFF
jgi:hypothetical protein